MLLEFKISECCDGRTSVLKYLQGGPHIVSALHLPFSLYPNWTNFYHYCWSSCSKCLLMCKISIIKWYKTSCNCSWNLYFLPSTEDKVLFLMSKRFMQLVQSIVWKLPTLYNWSMLPNNNVWCPSDILITSWLFTALWSMWPGNDLVPCVAELAASCIPIHAHWCFPDPKCFFYPSGLLLTTFALSKSMTWLSSTA